MRTAPLFLLVLALYALVTLHSALMQGYFVDGMIYASVARNLAEGYGSFWHMKLSEELFSQFREHPPLGIYIQSLFFRAFGDTELIDKFFGFVVGFGIMGFMVLIWRRILGAGRLAWFPLLMFVLLPATGYVLSYNWLEHILTLAIVAAAYCFIVALQANAYAGALLWSAAAGGMVFAGIMIKGPVALYPLAVPAAAALFLPGVAPRRGMLVLGIAVLALAGAFLLLFMLTSDAAPFFRHYFGHQVLGSIAGENSRHARTKLLESLLTEELIVPLVVGALLMLATRTGWRRLDAGANFRFFLAMALAGSLPLMISQKQNDYYLFIAMPFYALAFAALFAGLGERLGEAGARHPRRVLLLAATIGVLAVGVMAGKQGEYRKDKAYHQSFSDTGLRLPPRSMVSACPDDELLREWNLAANFQRYHSATLTRTPGMEYLVVTRESVQRCVDASYERISPQETALLLYRKKDAQ